MIDVKTLRSQNMFSKSDSSCSAWNKDQRKLQDEIILLDENRHNESFQNLFPVFASTQNNQQESPSQQHFLNNQKDNEKKPFYSSKVMASTDDMMAPQSICFIGDEEDVVEFEKEIEKTCKNDNSEVGGTKFNITSGNLTYRIASPSRPLINSSSFQNQEKIYSNEEVFSFNDEQPKWLKPPLRIKGSKNEKNLDNVDHQIFVKIEPFIQHSKFDDNGATQNNLNTNNFVNNATYNKYTDAPIQLKQFTESNNHNSLMNNTISSDRRHLEDLTNQQQAISPTLGFATSQHNNGSKGEALVIGTDASNLDSESIDEMERRKEKIMLLSLQRRQKQEESKAGKHFEENRRREREREKEEERARKKDEQKIKRAAILEHHRLKNAIVGAEREGNTLDRYELMIRPQSQSAIAPRLRNQKVIQSRPKTIHVDISETIISSRGKKGSTPNLTGYGLLSLNSKRQDFHKGSQDSLYAKKFPDDYPSTKNVSPIGQRGLYSTSRESTVERGRTLSRISAAKGNNLNFRGRKSNSLINLRDPGLGSATPPRRTESPGMSLSGRHKSSPSGPGSLPTALISKGRGFDSGSNIITYTPNSFMEYSGPKLYKQPTAKSNRGIILNAVEYCVFPGAVNRDAKQKVLEKIAQSEAKHFLVLFRDAGCQFRALYSYAPESNQVFKMYGTGPSQVDEAMFDKFLKYNSGGKCFSQVYTKHVTVTIDAFTIHNSLWQGKKIHLPTKKNMSLVI